MRPAAARISHRFAGIALLAGLVALVSCNDLSPTDELTGAQRRWSAWGPASYDLTVSAACECLHRPVVVRVRNGLVESRTYVADGQPVSFSEATLYPDVTGAFQMIIGAIRDGVLDSVDYDPMTGYPARIRLDFDGPQVNGADGEVTYTLVLNSAGLD
jgi:hypothetical protein